MASWSFLTNHARVLLCVARDPQARLRDIAASLGITERSAHGIVSDLAAAGYVVKQKDGRRNRYQVHARVPWPGVGTPEPAAGDVLALVEGMRAVLPVHRPAVPAVPAGDPDGSDVLQAGPRAR